MQHDFGMIGLGAMGLNLMLNLSDHGVSCAGYSQDLSKAKSALEAEPRANIAIFASPEEFMASLSRPRVCMMLVPAGNPVDSVIETLVPLLSKGDLIIDGGNSYFKDTERRHGYLAERGIAFFGLGVSGGESGARHGPSMMAGGPQEAYERVKPWLEAISAKSEDGEPCVKLLGPGAAGHYVKMVHNGIEYAVMQAIAEVFSLLRVQDSGALDAVADTFGRWAKGEIAGYLIEITAQVLRKRDPETGQPLVDLIKDGAKAKGTGKWTSQDAMDLGVPVPTIDAAVSARDLSKLIDEREAAARSWRHKDAGVAVLSADQMERALGAAMIIAYAQGLSQLRTASHEYGYGVKAAEAAAVWRAGCIIRSVLLMDITLAFRANPDLPNLLLDKEMGRKTSEWVADLRAVVAAATLTATPVPALSSALAYFDGMTTQRLPTYLIQAQRDCFGAHTYERVDKSGVFHTDWSE